MNNSKPNRTSSLNLKGLSRGGRAAGSASADELGRRAVLGVRDQSINTTTQPVLLSSMLSNLKKKEPNRLGPIDAHWQAPRSKDSAEKNRDPQATERFWFFLESMFTD